MGVISGWGLKVRKYLFGLSFALFVGLSWSASASQTAVLYSNGILTPLDVPGASSSEASSINNSGQILGGYNAGPFAQTFLYSSGTFSTLNLNPLRWLKPSLAIAAPYCWPVMALGFTIVWALSNALPEYPHPSLGIASQ